MFHIRESDLAEFRKIAKKGILYAAIKDSRGTDGMVDLVTNVDYVAQVNLFMEHRGYGTISQEQEDGTQKKDNPLAAQRGSSSPQRGNGSTPSRSGRTRPTRTTSEAPTEKPSVKEKLAACQVEAKNRAEGKQRTRPSRPKTR